MTLTDTEVDVERLERRGNALRILAPLVLSIGLAVIMLVGEHPWPVYAFSLLAYGLLNGLFQTLASLWLAKARGEDDFDRRYWIGLGVVMVVGITAICLWWVITAN